MENNNHNHFPQNEPSDIVARIFAQLAEEVLETGSGAQRQGLDIFALGPDLYHGASGLALFFAAYYRVTKDPRARKAAVAALGPVSNRIERLLATPVKPESGAIAIGGLIGLGSFLYVLAAAAEWLDAPEYLQSASALVGIITPELIQADQRLDLMTGSAGTLLGLLYFAHAAEAHGMPSGSAISLAAVCGEHLLHARKASHESSAPAPAKITPYAGFACGTCGISYALARLYRETQQEQFRDAALEGFAFEQTLYVAEHQGWRNPSSNKVMEPGSWCFGAPGIALARLACIAYLDEASVRHDLEEALRISRALPESHLDQLCCGNFGRIEVLQTAGSILGRLQLIDFARESSRRILEQASSERFRFASPVHKLDNADPELLNSSLFLGLAGVGYTLLRLSYPELIPSVLLFEIQP